MWPKSKLLQILFKVILFVGVYGLAWIAAQKHLEQMIHPDTTSGKSPFSIEDYPTKDSLLQLGILSTLITTAIARRTRKKRLYLKKKKLHFRRMENRISEAENQTTHSSQQRQKEMLHQLGENIHDNICPLLCAYKHQLESIPFKDQDLIATQQNVSESYDALRKTSHILTDTNDGIFSKLIALLLISKPECKIGLVGNPEPILPWQTFEFLIDKISLHGEEHIQIRLEELPTTILLELSISNWNYNTLISDWSQDHPFLNEAVTGIKTCYSNNMTTLFLTLKSENHGPNHCGG